MGKENDELYTPRILVNAIIPFVDKSYRVWCPFDTDKSEFVLALRENGNKVICSHISDGKDFFKYEPYDYDVIISNPPFTRKLDVFKRLFNLGKPFAMIMGLPILNYQEVGEFFCYNQLDLNDNEQLQLLIVDKKVSFNGNTSSFNNSFFCWKILPQDLMFAHLEHNNTGNNYKPSEMEKDRKKITGKILAQKFHIIVICPPTPQNETKNLGRLPVHGEL